MKNNKSSQNLRRINLYLFIVISLILIGVLGYFMLKNEPSNQVQSSSNNSVKADQVWTIESQADVIWDLKDPYYFYKTAPIAALVRIDSVGGGRNFSPISEQYVYPETIGKMTVLEVYKGDIKPGQKLNYARMGATLKYDQYLKGLSEEELSKIKHLSKGKKTQDYVKLKFFDDIDLKSGKKYLVFLQKRDYKNSDKVEYSIGGAQYGTHLVKGEGREAKAIDNQTKEWKSIGNFVKL
ncbi:hypothetical protein CR969_02440 [Candidatus Saccharibacteria bacterium]|nr:MAG: hypothetical protein CR969_02440 [Candidatus Saccharibacteria bacterium]